MNKMAPTQGKKSNSNSYLFFINFWFGQVVEPVQEPQSHAQTKTLKLFKNENQNEPTHTVKETCYLKLSNMTGNTTVNKSFDCMCDFNKKFTV